METDDILDKRPTSTTKVYKEKAVTWATFLGGPLVAGYLISENFKSLGEPNKVGKTWLIAIGATIAIIALGLIIPENSRFPNHVLPIAYTLITGALFRKHLKPQVDEHLANDGMAHGFWRVAGISAIGLAITIGAFFLIFYQANPYANVEIKTYGPTKNEIAYDPDNINGQEVDMLAEALWEAHFFDNVTTWYLYVHKANDNMEISIAVTHGTENDPDIVESFRLIKSDVDDNLPGYGIIFKLVTDDLENVILTIE